MSFLSILGKVAGSLIPGVGAVSSVLGKQQQGTAQGKLAQAQLQQGQDRTALDRYATMQAAQDRAAQTDLQRKSFESSNRSTTMKQALIGALLGGGGFSPTTATASGSSGGLLRALNANPDALSALKTMGSQGATAQTTPLAFQGGHILDAPALSKLPQIDQGGFLSTLAKIGELVGATSPYLQGIGSDTSQSTASTFARTPPQLAGVTPFFKPPTAKFPNEPDIYGGVY